MPMIPGFYGSYRGLACRVRLIRENPSIRPVEMKHAGDVHDLVRQELAGSDREMFLSVLVTSQNHLIGVETISIGDLNSCVVTAREVFKSAILANAAAIIVCHNHPSGSLIPSAEDKRITKMLARAGDLLGIKLLDHLIISHGGYRSVLYPDKKKKGERNHVI